jgi:predicted MFS family arabinose efflux permease
MHETGAPAIRPLSAYGLMVVGSLAAIYLVGQILRNSIGVIAPNLAAELGLTAATLGFLSSAFFVAFAAAQIPLGMGLDRFGPKLCMLVCSVVLVLGAVWFATAATPAGLIGARVLIGVGSSCYLMAPLAIYARRMPPASFSTLAGLHIGIGTIGTLIATAPLALSAEAIGWRATFWVIAGAIALTAALVALVVPADGEVGAAPGRRETLRESIAGTLRAMRAPHVPRLFLMHFMSYSGFVLIVGLWGGPYLAHVYGYGLTERGDFLFLAAGGQIVGLLLNGPLERLVGSCKIPVMVGAAASGLLLIGLAAAGPLPPAGLAAWLVAFGLISAYQPMLIAHGKALLPSAVLGRGMTLLNVSTMIGVFFSQSISGAVIGLFPMSATGAYPLAAYQVIFALQGVCVLLAILPYIRAHDPYRAEKRTRISSLADSERTP